MFGQSDAGDMFGQSDAGDMFGRGDAGDMFGAGDAGDMRGNSDLGDMHTNVDLHSDMHNPDLSSCQAHEICGNSIDDDCNNLIDCEDPACANLSSCIDHKKEQCDNGIDDDGNGLTDCHDPACLGDPHCFVAGHEICNNGLDDDGDGLIDCADPDCASNSVCMIHAGTEICDNGVDDNGDGLVDCADPQCVAFAACIHADCVPEIQFGTIAAHDANVSKTFDTRGAVASYATCAQPGGTARVGEFTLTQTTDVRLDFTQPSGSAHVVSVFRAGVGQACDQNPIFCLPAGQMATASHSFQALAAGTYRVIVQSYTGTQGATTVKLSTAISSVPEICNNGKDDDGNGLIDCADLACAMAANCTQTICAADLTVGTLVVGDPPKTATFNTTNTSNRYHPTCAGASTGNDYAVKFTLPTTSNILLQWSETGTANHIISIYQAPPIGQACDSIQQTCYDPSGLTGGEVAFRSRAAGDYIMIFKSLGPLDNGTMHISLSAFADRNIEICNNGIDDDGDGLIDCNDPDCFGVLGCGAPLCVPTFDLGDFSWGTSKHVNINTTMAQNIYSTTCGAGTGKEQVVRLNITEPMALGFNCTETGSHVLQLSAQINPLDACDANNFNCADPSILPFGCNFAMPDLQPGEYNVIVEAFQSGSEGTVSLTLSGIQETVSEICNNGIDDDMDGFTDCADLKCVTSPLCAQFACRADDTLGLIVLDGMTTNNAVVQTSGAGDNQHAPCTSMAGGQDAVVDFQLPAKADLTLEWAQTGNHDFALYLDQSDLAACDAGPLQSCTPTLHQSSGSVLLAAVPQGKYHLVVDADRPGSEGGVVIQITGTVSP